MAANKCVIVLAPNGRRQNVKVTPNTTILQILEEVCKKQGFKAEEYDIKHHNHKLDTSGLIRFSGLPNNAQLEMAPASKARQESNVFLGLQLESGNRLTGDFQPTESLWGVIKHLCPEEADPETNPVIIYMRREIYGTAELQLTTLRSLGLTGGRAMLHLIHRTPEQLHQQANVYQLQKIPSTAPVSNKRARPVTDPPSPERPSQFIAFEKPTAASVPTIRPEPPSPLQVDDTSGEPESEGSERQSYDSLSLESLEGPAPLPSERLVRVSEELTGMHSEDEIILLGERSAVIFNLAMAPAVPYEDLPEEFFDLTLDDARALYNDIKRRRAELDDAPLVTSALRELEESSRVLSQLNLYNRAVLRIQFPDRTVLQGTFQPLETIGIVREFVRSYLQDSKTEFHLFTTPPKRVLSPEERLVEAGCVPSALLYFGLDDPNQMRETYLREDLLTRFSSMSAASLAASQSRGIVPSSRPMSAPASSSNPTCSQSTSNVDGAGPSGLSSSSAGPSGLASSTAGPSGLSSSAATGYRHQPTVRQDSGAKVPKWFKPAGK